MAPVILWGVGPVPSHAEPLRLRDDFAGAGIDLLPRDAGDRCLQPARCNLLVQRSPLWQERGKVGHGEGGAASWGRGQHPRAPCTLVFLVPGDPRGGDWCWLEVCRGDGCDCDECGGSQPSMGTCVPSCATDPQLRPLCPMQAAQHPCGLPFPVLPLAGSGLTVAEGEFSPQNVGLQSVHSCIGCWEAPGLLIPIPPGLDPSVWLPPPPPACMGRLQTEGPRGGSALCAVPCTPGTHPAGASEGLIQSCEGLCGGLIKLLSPSCACPINQRCWLGKLGHGELPNPGDPPGAHQMPVPPARHLRHPRTAAQRPGRGWRVGMGTAGGDGSVAGHGRAGVLGRGWGGVVAMALRG